MAARRPHQLILDKPDGITSGLDLRTVDVESGVAYLMERYNLDRESALEKVYVAHGHTEQYEHAVTTE